MNQTIYLQIDNGSEEPVTWCEDQIYDTDIEYKLSSAVVDKKEVKDLLEGILSCIGNVRTGYAEGNAYIEKVIREFLGEQK